MTFNVDISELKTDYLESGVCLRPFASKYGMCATTARKYLKQAGIDTSKEQCFTNKVWNLIENINTVLSEYNTRVTVRQLFYQMATRHIVELSKKGYGAVQQACSKGRKHGYIEWNAIEDRTRQPHSIPMWDGLDDYLQTMLHAYRRNIWLNQTEYFEVWLEKSALYGVIFPITKKYGITLQTIKGYSSLSTIYDATTLNRFGLGGTILYLGDQDATGIDIDRVIKRSFKKHHKLDINVKRIGLLYDDIKNYNLPENFIKESDTRLKKYLAKGYTKQAELDALPPDVLTERVEKEIIDHLNMKDYKKCKRIEKKELKAIRQELNSIKTRFGAV